MTGMARRRLTQEEIEELRAKKIAPPPPDSARRCAEWVGGTKKRSQTVPDSRFSKAMVEVQEMMASSEWEDARPVHFLAAYALLHHKVYGVDALDLTAKTRFYACGMISRVLKTEFADDRRELAAFVRWTWQREEGRERYRRENHRDGGRIGWRLQFSGALMTEYRIDRKRRS